MANVETQKQILFASRYAYMYYQSVSDAFQDYSLSFTQNGKQAIDYLKKNKPSVVIFSENLKELDTLKLSKAIRKSSRLSATKIMLLIPDNRNISDIDEERKQTVDIILKQSQKPASFVTHIAKLLNASKTLEDSLNGNTVNIELDKVNSQNITSPNKVQPIVQPSAHPTPFPESSEHIYLFPEDEDSHSNSQYRQHEQGFKSRESTQAQNHPELDTYTSQPNQMNQQLLQTSKSTATTTAKALAPIRPPQTPIRPPQTPHNKPVYKDQQQTIVQASQTIQLTKQAFTRTIETEMPTDIISYPLIEAESTQTTKAFELVPEQINSVSVNSAHIESTNREPAHIEPAHIEIVEVEPAPLIEDLLDISDTEISDNFQIRNNYDNSDEAELSTPKTIAIIEDNASIAFLEKSILERQGYNTIQISDAPQAREFVDTNFDMADLVLLDLNLPGGSGFEILRRIRSFSRKPVIIVSGLKQSENIKRGLSLGAQDYLTKPMNPQELILRVSQHIKNFT